MLNWFAAPADVVNPQGAQQEQRMNKVKKIFGRYKWDKIAVWSGILVFCLAADYTIGSFLLVGCKNIADLLAGYIK